MSRRRRNPGPNVPSPAARQAAQRCLTSKRSGRIGRSAVTSSRPGWRRRNPPRWLMTLVGVNLPASPGRPSPAASARQPVGLTKVAPILMWRRRDANVIHCTDVFLEVQHVDPEPREISFPIPPARRAGGRRLQRKTLTLELQPHGDQSDYEDDEWWCEDFEGVLHSKVCCDCAYEVGR